MSAPSTPRALPTTPQIPRSTIRVVLRLLGRMRVVEWSELRGLCVDDVTEEEFVELIKVLESGARG